MVTSDTIGGKFTVQGGQKTSEMIDRTDNKTVGITVSNTVYTDIESAATRVDYEGDEPKKSKIDLEMVILQLIGVAT